MRINELPMKKQISVFLKLQLVSCLVLIFQCVFAQPITNLKIGTMYKTISTFENYLNSSIKLNSYYPNIKLKINSGNLAGYGYKDSMLNIMPNQIFSLDSLISILQQKKNKTDSTIKNLKDNLKDTDAIQKKLYDTLLIQKSIKELGDSSGKLGTILKQDKFLRDTVFNMYREQMYGHIVTIVKKDDNGKSDTTSIKVSFDHLTDLTSPISDKIKYLRAHRFQNRTYNATYLVSKDTTGARSSVTNLQDSIKNLIKLRTSIREYRKLCRNFVIFPAISRRTAKYFFGNAIDSSNGNVVVDSSNFYYFQNISAFNTDNIGNNTTLHAQLFSAYAGPIRLDAGTFFSLPKSDSLLKKKDSINALSSLATGGGNLTVHLSFPLVSFKYENANSLAIYFSSLVGPKYAVDIPSGTSSKNGPFSSYGSLGIANKLDIAIEQKVGVSVQFAYEAVWGTSLFMDNLGLKGDDRKKINLGSLTFGLSFFKKFAVSITTYTGTSSVLKSKLNNMISLTTNF